MSERREEPPTTPPADASEWRVEGTGETVGEAKWAALRELERRFPGIDKDLVRFEVLAEGERGLLGVGYAPARVAARVSAPPPRPSHPPGSPAARLHELLERVCAALGADVSIAVQEEESALVARLSGPGLGFVIGRRGQTIDAIQYLANAIVWRGAEARKELVLDAAGYQERRRSALAAAADRAAAEALRTGGEVALEPMSAAERKAVHLHLKGREDVETTSEGTEPNRRVVVRPASADAGADDGRPGA